MNNNLSDLKSSLKEFVKDLKKKGRSTATILAYQTDIRQLVGFLAEKKVTQSSSVLSEHIEAFKIHLFEKKYTPKSVSRKLNSIKTFFRFLKGKKAVKSDPAKDVLHPKLETKPPRILTRMEYRALRDAARDDARMRAIIELLLQTGMTIGELGRLELNDIKDNEVGIKAYESHDSRIIPLNKPAKKSLEKYLEVRPGTRTKNVFITRPGRPFLVRNIRTAINRYFRLAGIKDAKVNSLRHTFIAHQLRSGASVTLVQRLVGHKRLSTTEKYFNFIEGKETETVKLEEL